MPAGVELIYCFAAAPAKVGGWAGYLAAKDFPLSNRHIGHYTALEPRLAHKAPGNRQTAVVGDPSRRGRETYYARMGVCADV